MCDMKDIAASLKEDTELKLLNLSELCPTFSSSSVSISAKNIINPLSIQTRNLLSYPTLNLPIRYILQVLSFLCLEYFLNLSSLLYSYLKSLD